MKHPSTKSLDNKIRRLARAAHVRAHREYQEDNESWRDRTNWKLEQDEEATFVATNANVHCD